MSDLGIKEFLKKLKRKRKSRDCEEEAKEDCLTKLLKKRKKNPTPYNLKKFRLN